MINIVPKGFVSHTVARTSTSTKTDYGSGPETYDEDFDTYYGLKAVHNGDGEVVATVTDEHTWTTSRTIIEVRYKTYWDGFMGNYAAWNWYAKIHLKVNGSWSLIDTVSDSGAGSDPPSVTSDRTTEGTWEDVTGVKVEMYGRAYSYEGNRYQHVWLYAYETQAFYTRPRSYSGIV